MAIDKDGFADECVREGLNCGVHPHYILTVAQLRSQIAEGTVGNEIGPFRLTQADWDAHRNDVELEISFESDDVNDPDMQIPVFAGMVRRALDAFVAAQSHAPTAQELYVAQFPAAPAASLTADLQKALDATAALYDAAAGRAVAAGQTTPPKIPDPGQPTAAGGSGTASPFADKAKATATDEWNFFGGQTFNLQGHTTKQGHKENENGFFQRIGTYWVQGTGINGRDGRTDIPWSAAFISFVMKTSGAGNRFNYSAQHSVYISRAIHDFQQQNASAGYWGRRLNEAQPKVGDIVCWARQSGIDYDHQHGGDYAGHCDLVVELGAGQVFVIGGNVSNSVTRRPLALDQNGCVAPRSGGGETIIALMQNRI